MKSGKKVSFWTPKKVESLMKWHNKLRGKEDQYAKIATKVGATKSAVYQKLGRLGAIDAPWAKKSI